MPNIDVGPQSLRDAANGSRDLAGELRGVEPRPADRVKQAMPGSGAGDNAGAVGDYWDRKLRRLGKALDERADKLIAAATAYESGERETEGDFDRLRPRDPEARIPGK